MNISKDSKDIQGLGNLALEPRDLYACTCCGQITFGTVQFRPIK